MAERPEELSQRELAGARPRSADEDDEMGEREPDALRQDIAGTREEMGRTLDEIEDRVRPSRIMERRTAKMRSRFGRVRDAVMGTAADVRQRAEGVREGVAEGAGGAVGTMEQAPDAALERARGNPLGAALIAFGLGVVAAGVLPDTRQEQQVASAVTERLEPVKEQIGQAASEMSSDVADSARGAAQRTAEHARDEATAASDEVRGEMSGDS